jgi:hypothetical protein
MIERLPREKSKARENVRAQKVTSEPRPKLNSPLKSGGNGKAWGGSEKVDPKQKVKLGSTSAGAYAVKTFRTNSGWGDDISIPSQHHPDRPSYDAAHKQALADYFAGGDVKALRPVKVPLSRLDIGHHPLGSADRKALYVRMARQDRLPAIVVARHADRFKVVDGNHRHEAARAAGLTHVDAFEVRKPGPRGR